MEVTTDEEELVVLNEELEEEVKLGADEEEIAEELDVEGAVDKVVLVEEGEIVDVTVDDVVVLVDGFESKTPPTATAATTIITTITSAATVRLIARLLFKITLRSVAPVQYLPVI